ncbi:cytosine permease [Clostridium sp. AF19-22AC]|uniref:Cytosine permease n=1 Tax=Faecalicatena orotica TaxID=1544 RepID=A0A2Y9BG06_9FIRM|nr:MULTISPECIES: cytosine permease [Clostridia]PWJ27851.1 cytosine permease [Faecalicatena orotica]RHR29878.1 cytosine permease [Clostridium sp. AF19-22AC]SSA56872.1 cytosine permease [Faecalicatena orotica]
MGNEKEKTNVLNDYATSSVPEERTYNWLSMGLIWAGVGINLGMIVIGGALGNGLSFKQAVAAAFIGGIVLAIVTGVCGVIGAHTHLSTAMISSFTFGKAAIVIIALIQAFGSYGWFGVQLGLFGETVSTTVKMATGVLLPTFLCVIVGGILMILTSTFGYKSLDLLSKIAVPLLIILLVASVIKVMQGYSMGEIVEFQAAGQAITVGYGISSAIASFIVGAVVAPDVSRYAKSAKDTILAAIFAFAIVVPVMLVVGCLMAQVTGTSDIIEIMLRLGWGFAALLVLMLAQWTSNDNNLYCAALGFAVVFKKLKKYQITIISGVIGILLALTGIAQNITGFLNYLGVLIPPMGGVLASDYYFFHKARYKEELAGEVKNIETPACVAWVVGSAISFITTYTAVRLTTVPSIDGMLAAFLVHFIWTKLIEKNK